MPSHEWSPTGDQHEHPPQREDHAGPYWRTARFPDERASLRVYGRVQHAIARAACDLSAYRFQQHGGLTVAHYVAVVGERPLDAFDAELAALLAPGEPATLTPVMLTFLLQRRAQAQRLGPWVERHYRWPKGGQP